MGGPDILAFVITRVEITTLIVTTPRLFPGRTDGKAEARMEFPAQQL